MYWKRIKGNWNRFRDEIREQWDRLTPEDLNLIRGRRSVMIEILQERYGKTKEEAEKELQQYLNSREDTEPLEYAGERWSRI